MQTASLPLTVILCGSAVLMVSGTLTRLDVEDAMREQAAAAALDQGGDGEPERAAPSLKGDLLVAAPDLSDPYFAGTVIYLLAHDESGALGLVINRPRDVSDGRFTIYEGGPVAVPRVLTLHSDPHRGMEIEPGVYVAADSTIVDDVLKGAVPGRVFVWYAGWGPGQLERELAEGAWSVAPAEAGDVLGVAPRDCFAPY